MGGMGAIWDRADAEMGQVGMGQSEDWDGEGWNGAGIERQGSTQFWSGLI